MLGGRECERCTRCEPVPLHPSRPLTSPEPSLEFPLLPQALPSPAGPGQTATLDFLPIRPRAAPFRAGGQDQGQPSCQPRQLRSHPGAPSVELEQDGTRVLFSTSAGPMTSSCGPPRTPRGPRPRRSGVHYGDRPHPRSDPLGALAKPLAPMRARRGAERLVRHRPRPDLALRAAPRLRGPDQRLRAREVSLVRLDLLVPFSCKGPASCPRAAGAECAELAAHLVGRVATRATTQAPGGLRTDR
jgi:hypothetical protein